MQAQEEVIMIRGKRSKRPRLALTMATSSSSTAELSGGGGVVSDVVSAGSLFDRAITPTSARSNSGDDDDLMTQSTVDDQEKDMANCLILLAKGSLHTAATPLSAAAAAAGEVYTYQCKTCNRSFPSFQALGGHRASHKKPNTNNNKPILTTTVEDKKSLMRVNYKQEDFQSNGRDDSTIHLSLQIPNKSRVHECSICGAEFASGQALGGHMRRHRPIPSAAAAAPSGGFQEVKRPRNILSLDLNLPAPEDDHTESNKFPFPAKEQKVIVFSASPLVDCHY